MTRIVYEGDYHSETNPGDDNEITKIIHRHDYPRQSDPLNKYTPTPKEIVQRKWEKMVSLIDFFTCYRFPEGFLVSTRNLKD